MKQLRATTKEIWIKTAEPVRVEYGWLVIVGADKKRQMLSPAYYHVHERHEGEEFTYRISIALDVFNRPETQAWLAPLMEGACVVPKNQCANYPGRAPCAWELLVPAGQHVNTGTGKVVEVPAHFACNREFYPVGDRGEGISPARCACTRGASGMMMRWSLGHGDECVQAPCFVPVFPLYPVAGELAVDAAGWDGVDPKWIGGRLA